MGWHCPFAQSLSFLAAFSIKFEEVCEGEGERHNLQQGVARVSGSHTEAWHVHSTTDGKMESARTVDRSCKHLTDTKAPPTPPLTPPYVHWVSLSSAGRARLGFRV